MTDWTSRPPDRFFIPATGRFQMVAYEDGPNADKMGHDYKVTTREIDRNYAKNQHGLGRWMGRSHHQISGQESCYLFTLVYYPSQCLSPSLASQLNNFRLQ